MPREERKRREPPPVKKSPMRVVVPVLISTVVTAVIGVVLITGKDEEKAKVPVVEAASKPKPFADAPKTDPSGSGAEAAKPAASAPAAIGLANDATWQQAVQIAAAGEKLYAEAMAAKTAKDTDKLNEVGAQARDKLNEAFEMTSDWEDNVVAKHGKDHPEVRLIVTTRGGWGERLRMLNKSVAR